MIERHKQHDKKTAKSPLPSPLGTNGRENNGRFSPGNHLGCGNPLAGRASKIRAVLLEQLSKDKMVKIADRLIRMAERGNLASIRELLDRTMGKAVSFDVLETMVEFDERINKIENGQRSDENVIQL